jgi:hypothetical protein
VKAICGTPTLTAATLSNNALRVKVSKRQNKTKQNKTKQNQ